MKITDVVIKRRRSKNPNLVGYATVVFDNELLINDIAIIEKDLKFTIQFPRNKYALTNNKDCIVPLSSEFREYITSKILSSLF